MNRSTARRQICGDDVLAGPEVSPLTSEADACSASSVLPALKA
jgi:hypothetical protein